MHQHAHARTHVRTYSHVHTDTRTHAHMQTRTYAHTHTRTHAHTNSRTHAHADSFSDVRLKPKMLSERFFQLHSLNLPAFTFLHQEEEVEVITSKLQPT